MSQEIEVKFLDIEKLPISLPSDYADEIYMNNIFEYMNCDLVELMKELHRVLKKNGKIILSTPNVKFWKTRLLLLFGSDKPFEIKQYGAVRFFSPKSLIEILRKFGFKEDETHPMGRIPFLSLCGGFIVLAKKLKDFN